MIKVLMVAAATLVLIAIPAQAQFGGKRPSTGDKGPGSSATAPKIDEKAYKAALERIPDPKEKFDPWGVARPADTGKKPK